MREEFEQLDALVDSREGRERVRTARGEALAAVESERMFGRVVRGCDPRPGYGVAMPATYPTTPATVVIAPNQNTDAPGVVASSRPSTLGREKRYRTGHPCSRFRTSSSTVSRSPESDWG
jgi:hypothetical protein